VRESSATAMHGALVRGIFVALSRKNIVSGCHQKILQMDEPKQTMNKCVGTQKFATFNGSNTRQKFHSEPPTHH